MQVLHLQVLIRKKLVDIRGKIHPKDICFADFLTAHRRPTDSPLICLARWLKYQGNQLEDSIIFTLGFLIAEVYSILWLSANAAFETIIICSLIYALTQKPTLFSFGTLLNFRYELAAQLIAFGVLIGIFMLLYVTGVLDIYVVLGGMVTIAAVMAGKLLVYLQEWLFADTPNFSYSLQSNLIILIYIFWKGLQSQVAANPATLLPAMAALALANTVKVYRLFDYNVLAVINILSELNNRNSPEANQGQNASLELPQAASLMVQTRTEPAINSQAEQLGERLQQISQQTSNQTMSDSLNQERSPLKYESKKRIAITVLALLVFLGEVLYAKLTAGSDLSSIYSFFFLNIAGATFLLMLCEYEKSVKSLEKQGLTYVLVAMIDAAMVLSAGFLAYSRSTIGLDTQSAIFYGVFPFLASKQFSSACAQVHSHLDNGKFTSFFLCFLLPFSIRAVAFYAGWTIVVWLNDGLVCLYVLIAGLWGNRGEAVELLRDLRGAAASKKQKIKFLDRLKQNRANYPSIIQTFLYLHAITLISAYCFTTLTASAYQVQYAILYISPLFLYFACLASTHSLAANRPETYYPYLFTILALVLAVTYAVAGCGGLLGSSHQKYSLLVLLHALLFAALVQGQKIAVVRLPTYFSFVRALLVIIFFAFIYLPFISGFMAGYFFSGFSSTYFYYYTLGGFIYLWLVITAAGTAIHLVLNLTEKSKKDLFIAQYLESELKKIMMKENLEKFLMISNMYEMLNENSEDLLHYLRAEKNVVVVVRREKEYQHDYELADPEDHPADRRLDVRARRVNPLDLVNLQKTDPITAAAGEPENPVLTYFRDKERNRIQPVRPKDVNAGLLQLKAMAEKMRRTQRDDKSLQRSQQFKEMKTASAEAVAEYLGRFYNFLSEPSECLSRESFFYLMRLLTRQELSVQQTGKVYDRFSDSLMNQSQFKNFIVDYGEFRYDLRNAALDRILRTICCYDLVPILSKYAQLDYHLRRKAVKLTTDSWDIWLHDGSNQQTQIEFQAYKIKELQKKHKLLRKLAEKKVEEDQEEAKVEEVAAVGPQQKRSGQRKRTGKALLKDKILLKAENVYGVIVNAVTQGYMLYQKQAQIFQVKSIKASVSNLLALLTKVSDAIFVYGYSTVYLLFAYFKQDFTSSTYIFSGINYIILLGLIACFTVIYIALILYHKRDFETGTLGLDAQHRSLTLCDFKFYTIQLLFLLGSALANYIISIGLNSFLCDPTTQQLLNFSGVDCFSTSQEVCLFASLLILVVYWPLSAITFPFSTAMDRSLEIKYKSQFQIIYLQFKFLINGCNTLLAPFVFRTQQLCISALKVFLCCALAILCYRLHPCSYALMNRIEGKVYILLTILSFAGTLCFFVGLLYSLLITGSAIALYLVYFIYSTVKVYQQNEPQEDDLVDDHLRNQKVKIKIIRHQAEEQDTPAALNIQAQQSNLQLQSLQKSSPQPTTGTQQIKTISDQATKKTFNFW